MDDGCKHIEEVRPGVEVSGPGCEECMSMGEKWVHLRVCMTCGHVGCCDSSPHRHGRKHAEETGHPVIQSFEPDETWLYCFEDDATAEADEKLYREPVRKGR